MDGCARAVTRAHEGVAPLNQQRALSSTLLLLKGLLRARPHSTAKSTIFHCLCMMPVLPWSAVGGVRSEDA